MGWRELNQAQILHGDEHWPSFEGEITLIAPGVSDWILIPDKIQNVSITLSFTAGASGKVQTTTDEVWTVKTGVPIAVDWPFGEVGNNRTEICNPVSGIRAVQIETGTMKVTLRGQ